MGPIQSSMQGGSSSAEQKFSYDTQMEGGGGFRQSPTVNISQGSSSLRASTAAGESGTNWILIAGGVAAAGAALYLMRKAR
jgi:LPXTG-motif cell wall-anchored protein